MTIGEAVQLVLQAAAIGHDGDALVLDMGAPVRIYDVAKQMIDQSGLDVDVVFTGLKPGEKLHEALFAAGEPDERTDHHLISRVGVQTVTIGEVSGLTFSLPDETLVENM